MLSFFKSMGKSLTKNAKSVVQSVQNNIAGIPSLISNVFGDAAEMILGATLLSIPKMFQSNPAPAYNAG